MAGAQSFDELVARLAIDRLRGEAQQVASMRGLPADVRFTTEDEELALYDRWDESVDPVAVLNERFAKHTADGLPPDVAMAEAILETCAAGFRNRLRMSGGAGRLTLTEQVGYLERMAMKSRRRKGKALEEMPPDEALMDTPDQLATDPVPSGDLGVAETPRSGQGADF